MERIRILLVDDHRTFMAALTSLLEQEPDLDVVAGVPTCAAARAAVNTLQPDVVLVDIELGEGGSGIELIAELMRNGASPPAVVVVTCHDDVDTTVAAVRAGARAFVPKDVSTGELTNAVRAAVRGHGAIPPRLLGDVLERLISGEQEGPPEAERFNRLTEREVEVLTLLMAGLDRRDIAEKLRLSPNTVRTHVQNILGKLEVHSTLEAVSFGYRMGGSVIFGVSKNGYGNNGSGQARAVPP